LVGGGLTPNGKTLAGKGKQQATVGAKGGSDDKGGERGNLFFCLGGGHGGGGRGHGGFL